MYGSSFCLLKICNKSHISPCCLSTYSINHHHNMTWVKIPQQKVICANWVLLTPLNSWPLKIWGGITLRWPSFFFPRSRINALSFWNRHFKVSMSDNINISCNLNYVHQAFQGFNEWQCQHFLQPDFLAALYQPVQTQFSASETAIS